MTTTIVFQAVSCYYIYMVGLSKAVDDLDKVRRRIARLRDMRRLPEEQATPLLSTILQLRSRLEELSIGTSNPSGD